MTAYLLDTNVFLWLATDDERLTEAVREIALASDTELWLSAASVWELAIKKSLGKLELTMPLPDFLEEQRTALALSHLPISSRDAVAAAELPLHHRDPFDRLLVAQARNRRWTLITRDPNLHLYDMSALWQ
jgi:PIN domain nuclease of toxin-antitoxin system